MKLAYGRSILAAGIFALAASLGAQTITINSPAPGTIVTPGGSIAVSVTVSGAVAGIQSITVNGERDPFGAETFNYNPSPPTNSKTQAFTYFIPSDATSGEALTISASAQFYADSPVSTSIDVTAGGDPPPANDVYPGTLISGGSGTVSGTSLGATRQTGEPAPFSSTGGSVWYRWVAPTANMTTTFNTEGSAYDTVLGIYTGSAVNALSSVASDDDSGTGSLSSAGFNGTVGTTYYIQVSGFDPADKGAYTLNWSSVALTAAGDSWAVYE